MSSGHWRESCVTSESNALSSGFVSELRRQDLPSPTLVSLLSSSFSLYLPLYLMAPITRGASKNKAANKPTPAALKIKLTPGKIQSAIQLSATEKDGEVIEKVAALEAQLRDKREAELQEALTLPMPLEQAAAESPPLELPTSGAEDYSSHCNNVRREEGGALMEETPLVYQQNSFMNMR